MTEYHTGYNPARMIILLFVVAFIFAAGGYWYGKNQTTEPIEETCSADLT